MKKYIYAFVLFMLAVAISMIFIAVLMSSSSAETISVWVMCQPKDYINVRESPSRKSSIAGRFDPGDELSTDGKTKNNYLHINTSLEDKDAWIHSGYVVYDEPVFLGGRLATVVSNGRLAARKYIGGKVRKWLYNGDELKVYYMSEEWSVTNKGFVKTQYIELEGY